jgi:UDP-N-acetylmuramate--alanine ligase
VNRPALDLRALAADRPVHFMGVGGAGMYPLAELLLRSGGQVSGCDVKDGPALRALAAAGGAVEVGHDPVHTRDAAALVVTSAVPQDHPELIAARGAGVPVLKRAEALGAWVASGTVVAIAGTHGKTTTTAMATQVLAEAGQNPTGIVGGRVQGWDGNLRLGSDDLFVVEADEYDRSFLTLSPDVAVVTNVEADHLDIYGDLEGVRRGFLDFLTGVRGGGRVVVCADDHGASRLLPYVGPSGYTYGTAAGSMLRATDLQVSDRVTSAVLIEDGRHAGRLEITVGGRHNLLNALAAAAVGRSLGVDWSSILSALADFQGVQRRLQKLGEVAGVTVVDDYAHHPTEIIAALSAVRGMYSDRRVVAVFQPHLYSRTRDFAREFGEALAGADELWVTDVFPAREAPLPGITGEVVSRAAEAAGASAVRYVQSVDLSASELAATLAEGDVVVTLGAGSIERLGSELLETLGAPVHA